MVKDLFCILTPHLVMVAAIFCQAVMSLIKSPRLLFKYKNINILTSNIISLGTLIASVVSILFLWQGEISYGDSLVVTPLITVCSELILVSTMAVILINGNLLNENRQSCYKYHILLLTATLGALCTVCANDFLTLFVALETLSFSLYFLITFSKGYSSKEAGFKYLLTNSVSVAFFLFGVSYFLGLTSSVSFTSIVRSLGEPTNLILYSFASLLVFIGLVMKLAVFPFANWILDVYAGCETSILAFLSSVPKIAIICVLMRLLSNVFGYSTELTVIILLLAVFTALWANIYAVKENNVKKILACSSSANGCYMLIVLPLVTNVGMSAVLFYLITYVLMNIGVWAYLNILEPQVKNWGLDNLKRVDNIWAGASFVLLVVGLAGLPVSAGFVAKIYLMYGLLSTGLLYLPILFVLLILFAISLYYYIRLIRTVTNGVIAVKKGLSTLVLYVMSILTFVLGVLPFGLIMECVRVFK